MSSLTRPCKDSHYALLSINQRVGWKSTLIYMYEQQNNSSAFDDLCLTYIDDFINLMSLGVCVRCKRTEKKKIKTVKEEERDCWNP